MFYFESRMLEKSKESVGRRRVTNEKIMEELCSSVTLVPELHAFYTQAYINEKEILRFEGYTLESNKLKPYWEWKVTGIYLYEEETKTALIGADIDAVELYEMLNQVEAVLYEKIGKPQYFRNNRVKITRADYDVEQRTHTFVDTYYEITNEQSYVTATQIESIEILHTTIPVELLREKEILKEKEKEEQERKERNNLLGF